MYKSILGIVLMALLGGCAHLNSPGPSETSAIAPLSDRDTALAARIGVPAAQLATILSKPIYQMTPVEAGRYIAYMQLAEPDLRARIAAIGRKNIGQPYILNLLGEYPFELHDSLPLFSLTHSDCVVFAEHTYAMALSHSWEEFFWMLQRIRYKDGVIGVTSRNHYTEQDWNINNRWLVTDISRDLTQEKGPSYALKVDRSNFLKKRHHTVADFSVQVSTETYVAKDDFSGALPQLQDGDFVNVISTKNGEYWASHVGLVVVDANGQRNFLNSAEPKVREESFDAFLKRTAEREQRNANAGIQGQLLAGFKFLRLNDTIDVPPAAAQPRPSVRPY